MILIADSGSTKTDWVVVTKNSNSVVLKTQGINPVHQSREEIVRILREEFQAKMGEDADVRSLRSSGVLTPDFPLAVYFYGSGVRPEKQAPMEQLLREVFPQAMTVEAHSDLLGAARALFGHHAGIACILGTGANSCYYDGERIVKNTPALGYILGDEGGGAALGKRFLHDLYGGVLGEEAVKVFEKETKLKFPEIIDRVYRQPLANRFLASLSEFIHRHLDDLGLNKMVGESFTEFLSYHVVPYRHPELPVSFIGSVAWNYQEELRKSAEALDFRLGNILPSPIAGLINYHTAK